MLIGKELFAHKNQCFNGAVDAIRHCNTRVSPHASEHYFKLNKTEQDTMSMNPGNHSLMLQ